MTLSELKSWLDSLPEDFNNFQVMNGGEMIKEDIYFYRIDNPIMTCVVDKESKQIIFLNDFYDDKKES